MDAFPELKKYEGCWVVNDFMLLHLKNTARRGRMAAEKLLAAKGASEDKKIKKSKRSSK
jgi:hypothetical protein